MSAAETQLKLPKPPRSRRSWWILGGAALLLLIIAVYFGWRGQMVPVLGTRSVVVSGNEVGPVNNLPKLIATYRDGYPDMVVYSEGRHSGPLRYVTEEAAKRIGYVIEWKRASYKNSLAGLEDGSVDILPYIFYKTPERELESWFSSSLGLRPRPVYFLAHKSSDAAKNLKTFEDLSRYTVGFRGKSYYFAEFHAADHFTKIPFDQLTDLVHGFIHNKVEVMALTDKWETERELTALGYDNYAYSDLKFEKVSDVYYFYSRKPDRTNVLKRFDQALVQMKSEGKIDEIYRSFDVDPPL